MGLVGQQQVNGGRIRNYMDPDARTFPYFNENDKFDPMAIGFCPNSYIDGLSPIEFYCHCIGGREGKYLMNFIYKILSTNFFLRND